MTFLNYFESPPCGEKKSAQIFSSSTLFNWYGLIKQHAKLIGLYLEWASLTPTLQRRIELGLNVHLTNTTHGPALMLPVGGRKRQPG